MEFDFGTWVYELDGTQTKVLSLRSRVYGPSATEDPETVWKKMVDVIHLDLKDGIEMPPPAEWAREVVDAKLDGTGPRLSYLSVVWSTVTEELSKTAHRSWVKHLMRLRVYRNLTWNDFRRMNLPPALVQARLETAPVEVRAPLLRYIESIDKWISQGVGFLIRGKPRSGKSGCAAILAKAAVSRGRSAYFTRISELREAIKSDATLSDDTLVWDRCRHVDFLVLDNLTAEDATLPYLNAASVKDLITFRGERHRPTVLTAAMQMTLSGSAEAYLVTLDVPGEAFKNTDAKQEILEGKRG